MKNLRIIFAMMVMNLLFTTTSMANEFLADRHAARNIKCASCHGDVQSKKVPSMDKCLKCHGGSYEKLSTKTKESHPNPHYTHIGDKECSACHKGHQEAQFFCNDCHNFELKMP
ncbi:cytochrome c3 family protein [Shewanella mangrovisoli]|uniref:cytochrome c3 family protein n=1 Tax=Shewanella mangrovisoli TaxID=2864211 RepID=UPI0035BB0FCA